MKSKVLALVIPALLAAGAAHAAEVYNKDGKLIAQTELKQCKYATRVWTKQSKKKQRSIKNVK